MNKYMLSAIEEARLGIQNGEGGPFGACVVRDGEIIALGHNTVLKDNDPTRHGEMNAIKNACLKLKTYDLSDCELYTTGEPCTMCLCACMWANISHIYYACSIKDNEKIGFRDNKFDELLGGREKIKDYLEQIDRDEGLKLFEEYNSIQNKIIY